MSPICATMAFYFSFVEPPGPGSSARPMKIINRTQKYWNRSNDDKKAGVWLSVSTKISMAGLKYLFLNMWKSKKQNISLRKDGLVVQCRVAYEILFWYVAMLLIYLHNMSVSPSSTLSHRIKRHQRTKWNAQTPKKEIMLWWLNS